MSNDAVLIDVEMPAPGEPLTPLIDSRNEAALAAQVAQRQELLRSRLTKKEIRSLKRRYEALFRTLTRAKYNQLITERAAIHDELVMVKAAYLEKPTQALRTRGLALTERGRAVQAKIAPLSPLAAEFESIVAKLDAHRAVVELERQEEEDRKNFFKEAAVFEKQIQAVFKQSPRLHNIQQTKRGKTIMKTPRLSKAFIKADKIYFTIQTMSQNVFQRWGDTWTSALPYGVDVADLVSDVTLQNLTAACGRVVKVERNQRSQNIFYVINRLDSSDGLPRRILFDQVIEHYPRHDHLETPWPGGVGEDRKIVWQSFTDFPHVLIAGTNGGGKSNLINQMIATLITMNSPEEIRLLMIDNKGGIELSHFDGIPHLLRPMVNQIDDVLPALQQLSHIMRERFAMFLKVNARKLTDYNRKVKNPIPRIVCVIDEMATLVGVEDTEGIQRELRNISSQGRAVGIHLVISTQHPSVDVIPGWIKTNLNLRIAAKMPHHSASQIIVDSISAALLPDIPGRMVFRRGGFELTLQTPLIEDAGIARAVKLANKFAKPAWQLPTNNAARAPLPLLSDEALADVPPVTEHDTQPVIVVSEPPPDERFGRDDFLKLAFEQLEGKLSPTRAHALLGNEIITLRELRRLVQNVIDEIQENGGLIVWNGQEYRIAKQGKTHVLKPIEQVIEQVIEHETPQTQNTDETFDRSIVPEEVFA